MIDYRLRRPASGKPKKAETAARVAEIVGGSLREIRRRQGHSLDTLAAASGVSRAMLGQIETGKSVPTITVLWKIAAALNVPLAELITDPDVSSYSVTRRSDAPQQPFAAFQSRPLKELGYDGTVALEEFRIAPGHCEIFAQRMSGGHASLVVSFGAIEITIGSEPAVRLGEADAIHFSASAKLAISNVSDGPAIAYFVYAVARGTR